jgi:small-conductance mechanosensitive channel
MTGFDPALLLGWSKALTATVLSAGLAIAIALVLHLAMFAVLRRAARLSEGQADDAIVDRLNHPARWSMVAVAISIAAEHAPLLARVWDEAGRFIVPALTGWVAYALVKASASAIESHASLTSDEMVARSRKTRITILSRSAGFVIIVFTIALMLFNVPAVRSIGVTLLASAGLTALAVGAAAQPALKSFIAGIQMAITEPIRLGDLVVIDDESGRVEDIRMSYVVIRTGDERRLIVPTTKFLDTPFQNWTRVGGGITGSVSLPIKPGFAFGPIRQAYMDRLSLRPEWDERTGGLNVSEVRVGWVELRLVMSAPDPAALDRLRLAMREGMLEWLRENMPDALCDEV